MKVKYIRIVLVIVLLFSLTFLSFKYIENIKADSGWDSSYDSGGSSWDSGGSSWDNDYDYDYGYDNDYSSSGSSGNSCTTKECKVATLVLFTVILFISIGIPFLVVISSKISSKRKITKIDNKIKELLKGISQETANSIISNFNIEEFCFEAYQIFYNVQMSWMEFEYDKLKDLLTDELYNNYVMQLDALKFKNHKNTMKGFELIETKLSNLKEENDKYIAEVYLNVKFYDYVENAKTGVILRGTPNRKLNNIYKLTFIKSKKESMKVNECPRCGAPVEGNIIGVCEYCKSKLVNETHDWIMSKKEIIRQR